MVSCAATRMAINRPFTITRVLFGLKVFIVLLFKLFLCCWIKFLAFNECLYRSVAEKVTMGDDLLTN